MIKKSLKIPKGVIRHHNRRRTDNIMTKRKKTDKTMIDEILHRKLKIGQPKAHWKLQIGQTISCFPSGTCCVTVKRQDYYLKWKSCWIWIWIPYKMGIKTNRTSYLRGNRSGHHNIWYRLRTSKPSKWWLQL
jgi:hypothetical protein